VFFGAANFVEDGTSSRLDVRLRAAVRKLLAEAGSSAITRIFAQVIDYREWPMRPDDYVDRSGALAG
jgi:hypothetical protein